MSELFDVLPSTERLPTLGLRGSGWATDRICAKTSGPRCRGTVEPWNAILPEAMYCTNLQNGCRCLELTDSISVVGPCAICGLRLQLQWIRA